MMVIWGGQIRHSVNRLGFQNKHPTLEFKNRKPCGQVAKRSRKHRDEGTNLCQHGFVDAVDVGFGLRLDILSQCFVTDGAVDQWLRRPTQRKECKFQQEFRADMPVDENTLTLSFLWRHPETSAVLLGQVVALRWN